MSLRLPGVLSQVRPAVVAIANWFEQPNGSVKIKVLGTGFCVDPAGIIVTCEHVLSEYLRQYSNYFEAKQQTPEKTEGFERLDFQTQEIKVLFYRVTEHPTLERTMSCVTKVAQFCMAKTDRDFALLRLLPGEELPILNLGDSNALDEGMGVGVCGFPYGDILHKTVGGAHASFQLGIVSAILPFRGVPMEHFRSFQLDMLLNPGNSGGPVFLQETGEVVGIVTSTFQPQQQGIAIPSHLSYAIPINQIKPFVDELKQMSPDDMRELRIAGRTP